MSLRASCLWFLTRLAFWRVRADAPSPLGRFTATGNTLIFDARVPSDVGSSTAVIYKDHPTIFSILSTDPTFGVPLTEVDYVLAIDPTPLNQDARYVPVFLAQDSFGLGLDQELFSHASITPYEDLQNRIVQVSHFSYNDKVDEIWASALEEVILRKSAKVAIAQLSPVAPGQTVKDPDPEPMKLRFAYSKALDVPVRDSFLLGKQTLTIVQDLCLELFRKVVFHKHQDGGCFGDIWRGTTIKGSTLCAVKVIKQTGRSSAEAEGRHEYDLLERVKADNRSHPNIVAGLELMISPQTGMVARFCHCLHMSESHRFQPLL